MGCEIDDLDLEIIWLLQEDGRTSNVEIARALRVAESTIRKRLDRLLQNGVVRITAIPNLQKVGLPVEALIFLQVSPARAREVVNWLKGMPEVRSLRSTTGEYQLVLEASFSSEEAFHLFLSERLPAVPGIVRISTAQVLHTTKECRDWQLPRRTPALILVVDDDPDFVETTRLALQGKGYRVVSAANGQEALEEMRGEVPDLVILDVMMRGVLDGVSVSEAMRQDRRLAHVPVLMISSIPDSPYAGMFPSEGDLHVDSFLTKPVSPEQLAGRVRRLLVPVRGRSRFRHGAGSPVAGMASR